MNRLLRIRTGRQPHEMAALCVTLVLGLVGSFGPERISNAIAETFPTPWASVFWAGFAIFGAVGLWGVFAPKVEGLLIERIALVVLVLFYGTYTVTVIFYSGLAGLVSTLLPVAFAAGSVGRVVQIGRDLVLLKSYLRDHPGEIVR